MAIFGWTQNKRKAAQGWIDKGNQAENLEEKCNCYVKAIELDPECVRAWIGKGWSLIYLGRHEEAMKAFETAIEIDPDEKVTWHTKGVSLSFLGRHEEAIKAFNQAIEIDPKYARAWSGKGVSLANLGKHEEAIKALDKAIEIDPKYAIAWSDKGISLANLDKYEDAIKAFDKAIELDPKYPPPWFEEGNVLTNLGRYEESLALYKRATAFSPNSKALQDAGTKTRMLLFRSLFKLTFSFTHTGLEYDTWQVCTLTIANTGTKQLKYITLSFSGEIEVRGLKRFSLPPSEQKNYECSLKALARGTVPVEVTVTAEDSTGEKYATTYDYSIQVSDPQRSAAPLPVSPAIAKQIFSPEMFPLERTIYDPVARDFLVSSERPLVNVRKWIEDRDPGSYWCVVCIHNDSDSPIDEWGYRAERNLVVAGGRCVH